MVIRDFEPHDLNIYRTMSQDFYSGEATLTPVPTENFDNTFAQCLSRSPYTRGLILEEEDLVIGYALLAFYWSCEAGGMVTQLEELYVSPAARGKQAGSRFLTWMMQEYKPTAKRFRLEVCPSNPQAKKLYERFGFHELDYRQMVTD